MCRSRVISSIVSALAALLVIAGPSVAAEPWPFEGQNSWNQRNGYWSGPPNWNGTPALTKIWERRLGGDVLGTPVLAIGGVFVGSTDGTFYALHQSDGKPEWVRRTNGAIYSSPLFVNNAQVPNTIYLLTTRTGGWNQRSGVYLIALDAYTGTFKWETHIEGADGADAFAAPTYSQEQNLVYVGTCSCKAELEKRNVSAQGTISAVDASSGALIWRQVAGGGGGVGIANTPMVADSVDRLYIATSHAYSEGGDPIANSLYALDTADGSVKGSAKVSAGDWAPNGDPNPLKKQGFVAAPIVAGNQVVIGARNGTFYSFDPLTLQQRWSAPVGIGSSEGGVVGTPAFDGQRIFGSSAMPGIFWALGENGGFPQFAFPADDALRYGPISVTNGGIWTTNTGGFVEVRAMDTGRPLRKGQIGAPSTGGVSFADGVAFAAIGTPLGTGGGGVAAFR